MMDDGGKVEARVMMEAKGITEAGGKVEDRGKMKAKGMMEAGGKVEDRGKMEAMGIMETERMTRRPKNDGGQRDDGD